MGWDEAGDRMKRWVVRVLLVVLGLVVTVRAGSFLAVASYALRNPIEEHHLESKMVHLCWRAQHGVTLYPEWRSYPYVSNFFSPVYFMLVGRLGRVLGTSLDGLFPLGRAATIASDLAAAVLLGVVLWRRYGPGPALVGALLTLGAGPMEGFGTMVRPDILADLLGFAGFVAATSRHRAGPALGVALFVLAIFTKQTAAMYLVAAGIALLIERRGRAAILVVLITGGVVGALVAAVTATVEPHFLSSLLAESRTPVDMGGWKHQLERACRLGPDLPLLLAVGLVLWNRPGRRQVPWTVLALVLTVLSVAAAVKRGADVNYFLGLRLVAALAVGTLCHEARHGLRGGALLLGLVAVALVPSLLMNNFHVRIDQGVVRFMDGRSGRTVLRIYRGAYAMADDPRRRILTDAGLIDIRQGERALFADPWLFHLQAETGRIDLRPLEEQVERRDFELIVTQKDLFADDYLEFDQGLPRAVVARARLHYRSLGKQADLFFYVPRDD
jgi:hypothetical protein